MRLRRSAPLSCLLILALVAVVEGQRKPPRDPGQPNPSSQPPGAAPGEPRDPGTPFDPNANIPGDPNGRRPFRRLQPDDSVNFQNMADYFALKPVPGIDVPPTSREEVMQAMLNLINEKLKSQVNEALKDSVQVDDDALKESTGPKPDNAAAVGAARLKLIKGGKSESTSPEDVSAKGLAANKLKGLPKRDTPPAVQQDSNPADDLLGELPVHQLKQIRNLLSDSTETATAATGRRTYEPIVFRKRIGQAMPLLPSLNFTNDEASTATAATGRRTYEPIVFRKRIGQAMADPRQDSGYLSVGREPSADRPRYFDGRFLAARDLTGEQSSDSGLSGFLTLEANGTDVLDHVEGGMNSYTHKILGQTKNGATGAMPGPTRFSSIILRKGAAPLNVYGLGEKWLRSEISPGNGQNLLQYVPQQSATGTEQQHWTIELMDANVAGIRTQSLEPQRFVSGGPQSSSSGKPFLMPVEDVFSIAGASGANSSHSSVGFQDVKLILDFGAGAASNGSSASGVAMETLALSREGFQPAGNRGGNMFIPEVGDEVLAGFEHNSGEAGSAHDKRKQSLYFPEDMLKETQSRGFEISKLTFAQLDAGKGGLLDTKPLYLNVHTAAAGTDRGTNRGVHLMSSQNVFGGPSRPDPQSDGHQSLLFFLGGIPSNSGRPETSMEEIAFNYQKTGFGNTNKNLSGLYRPDSGQPWSDWVNEHVYAGNMGASQIPPGDVLLDRWQRNGIGHAVPRSTAGDSFDVQKVANPSSVQMSKRLFVGGLSWSTDDHANDRFNGKYFVTGATHQYDKVVVRGWNPEKKEEIVGEAQTGSQIVPGFLEYANLTFSLPEGGGSGENPQAAVEVPNLKFTFSTADFLTDPDPFGNSNFKLISSHTTAGIAAIRNEQLNNKYPENMQHEHRQPVSVSNPLGLASVGGTSRDSDSKPPPMTQFVWGSQFPSAHQIDDQGRYKVRLPTDGEPVAETHKYTFQRNESNLSFHRQHNNARVKVKFPWLAPDDSNASAGYGMHLPLHAGTETVIAHVSEDQQLPPFSLPGPKQISGLKSNSAGGGGQNDRRFWKSRSGHSILFNDADGSDATAGQYRESDWDFVQRGAQGSSTHQDPRPANPFEVKILSDNWDPVIPSVETTSTWLRVGQHALGGSRIVPSQTKVLFLAASAGGWPTARNAFSSNQPRNEIVQRYETDLEFVKRLAARNGFLPSAAPATSREFYNALISELKWPALDGPTGQSSSGPAITEELYGNYNFRLELSDWGSEFRPGSFDVKMEGKNATRSGPLLAHELSHVIQQLGGMGPHSSATDGHASAWVRVSQLNNDGAMILPSRSPIVGGFKDVSGMDSEPSGVIRTASGITIEMEDQPAGGAEPFGTVDGLRVPDAVGLEQESSETRKFNLLSNVMKTKTDSADNSAILPSPGGPVPIPYPNFAQTGSSLIAGDPDRPIIAGAVPNAQTARYNFYPAWPVKWYVPSDAASDSNGHSTNWIRMAQPHGGGGFDRPLITGRLFNGAPKSDAYGQKVHVSPFGSIQASFGTSLSAQGSLSTDSAIRGYDLSHRLNRGTR